MKSKIYVGNVKVDGKDHRGWVVGRFLDDPEAIRHTKDVEIKWAKHDADQCRADWTTDETATTFCLLISGRLRLDLSYLPNEPVVLEEPGDYAMWGPEVLHRWKAESETTVLTVRWPAREPDKPGSALIAAFLPDSRG